MLRDVRNESWKQHPTKQQLYGYLSRITKTTQGRRPRHLGHYWCIPVNPFIWRSKCGTTSLNLSTTALCLEDQPGAMDVTDEWREWVREICASSTIWWWWWVIFVLLMLVLSVLFLIAVAPRFLCSLLVVSMHQCNLKCCNSSSSFFSWHI